MVFIGNQTSCWASSIVEPFDYAVAQSFDAFEWFPDKKPGVGWDESDLDAGTRQAIRDTARTHQMRLSVHARWQANPLTEEGNKLLWKEVELARDLGAVLLNLHLFHEQGLPAFAEAIRPLVWRTAQAGLQLSIENTPHHSPEQFNELFARVRAIGSVETSHVGMCLDLGHANLSSATHNDYLGFCDRLEPEVPIIHLHVHENWGDSDSHLPLFTGPAWRDDSGIRGLVARLKHRNFSGSVILEQWPQPPSLLNASRDRLLELWEPIVLRRAQNHRNEPGIADPQAAHGAPLPDLASELAAGDRQRRSWREKLEFVSGLLAKGEPAISSEQLVDIAIYLRFLGTGEVVCAEDGRHFRPAHHARIAAQIHQRLASLRTPQNEFILRKIYPWLPSSAATFQRPEPLTRIRDIAHRNDIGPDLKREIKTRLQNKLHRCAGPEDLATSSALLERIAAPGAGYPREFVEQFRVFHEELKEFFNARLLEDHLVALVRFVESGHADLIRLFLRQKAGGTLGERLASLRSLTELRHSFVGLVEQKPGSETQELILADISLEDFAFVLLSQIINDCENAELPASMTPGAEALTLALENLALSRIDYPESCALEHELRTWGNLSAGAGRNEILRWRASVLRCRRLAGDFGDRTVQLFAGRVEKLGRALGVAEHAIRVFSEAAIRSHVVFQVSKLADGLLRRIRERLGLSPWEVIVAGRAVGRAITLSSLEEWKPPADGAAVVLLRSAAGDEEIPIGVAAIALAHEIPHLSHLSVRARQAHVVFIACEEAAEFERLQGFEGQVISLNALPDGVSWETNADRSPPAVEPRTTSMRIPLVRLSPKSPWLRLEQVTARTGGGKAAGARRLAEISRLAGADFSTPRSLVIPFGVMETAMTKMVSANREYRDLVERLGPMEPAKFADIARRLKELVQELAVPEVINTEIRRAFGASSTLVVRSSANCEDLEELAGAGLYESVINVSIREAASAIRTVWSSLWTLRAAESRRAGGIRHDQAHMAVLVQELLDPDFSFVLHTVNPITHAVREVYAEIVLGLGETLASAATFGTPYRLTCDKNSAAVNVLAFANFSEATRPNPGGGVRRETVDYSQVDLSGAAGALEKLGRGLSAIGVFVEGALGAPQDIEGAVVKDLVYLVQTRPQQGLPLGKGR